MVKKERILRLWRKMLYIYMYLYEEQMVLFEINKGKISKLDNDGCFRRMNS